MRKTFPRFFASLDFGGKETAPSDMDPVRLVKCMPYESMGVTLFDILVANPDRHTGNIKVDDPENPTSMEVFDHDRALFGYKRSTHGKERLQHVWDRLGLCDGLKEKNHHRIAPLLVNATDRETWLHRIEQIPDVFIEDVCQETCDLGITNEECETVKVFLKDRKRKLREIIDANRPFFKSIKNWGLL